MYTIAYEIISEHVSIFLRLLFESKSFNFPSYFSNLKKKNHSIDSIYKPILIVHNRNVCMRECGWKPHNAITAAIEFSNYSIENSQFEYKISVILGSWRLLLMLFYCIIVFTFPTPFIFQKVKREREKKKIDSMAHDFNKCDMIQCRTFSHFIFHFLFNFMLRIWIFFHIIACLR